MFYRFLGMLVWWVAKRYLRQRRYGASLVPTPVMIGAGVALAALGILLGRRRLSSSEG